MQPIAIVRALGAGVLVYLGVAACTAAVGSRQPAPVGFDDAPTAEDAESDTSGGTVADPVPSASAQTAAGASVAVEKCDKRGSEGASTDLIYAVHAYPGKKMVDLAKVVAIAHYLTIHANIQGEGVYENRLFVPPLIRDGSVAFSCGTTSTRYVDSVTFILPN